MQIYNTDCISGARQWLSAASIDLFLADPPFGIAGDKLHKHYNRDENNVLAGYVEAPEDYYEFSLAWLTEAKRILKATGSMYIVSGWSNLHHILNAINALNLVLINHIIWKFNFGVYTSRKYVTSHYHILYVKLNKSKPVFNTNCRFTNQDRDNNRSLLYRDMEDVWIINKEYQPGQIKNKNKLPDELIEKMILYSSNEGNHVCDFFLGNFTTAYVAKRLNRIPIGFEINPESFNHHIGNFQ